MKHGERGSQLVEAGLGLVIFCALLFLLIDVAWSLFVKVTLQHAVAEGVRYAITGQTASGAGQLASIKSCVQLNALGLLNGAQSAKVAVRFYDPKTLLPSAWNAGGNVVEVSVEDYQVTPLAPLLRSGAAVSVTVRAADILEPTPGGIPPPL